MLVKVLMSLLVSGLLLYIIYFTLIKILFCKSRYCKEIDQRLILRWSIFAYLIVFHIYLFILFYQSGAGALDWTNPVFYFGIFPQLIVYFGLVAFFFIKRHALKKSLTKFQ